MARGLARMVSLTGSPNGAGTLRISEYHQLPPLRTLHLAITRENFGLRWGKANKGLDRDGCKSREDGAGAAIC
jgi:hypothetical protein